MAAAKKKAGRGRPLSPPGRKRGNRVVVALTDDQWERFVAQAEAEQLLPGELAYRIVSRWIERATR